MLDLQTKTHTRLELITEEEKHPPAVSDLKMLSFGAEIKVLLDAKSKGRKQREILSKRVSMCAETRTEARDSADRTGSDGP